MGLDILYILLFGLGSVDCMAVRSLVIALPLRASAARLNYVHWSLTALGGFKYEVQPATRLKGQMRWHSNLLTSPSKVDEHALHTSDPKRTIRNL